jgi:DNA-binding MarR family transcriptional regulator
MGFPKSSLAASDPLPHFENPQSIFDLLNFQLHEFLGISGSLVTRICENEYGITREEWQFAAMLAELGGMSPSDRSQASKTLRGLMTKGLVDRQPVPGDGRKARVQLTEAGMQLYGQIFPRVVQVHNEVIQDLCIDEREALARAMHRLRARALAVAQRHKPEGATGRRLGGSRAKWKSTPLAD